ncbi:MAG: signal peptidase I [Erysipelotrichaceae bacterium]
MDKKQKQTIDEEQDLSARVKYELLSLLKSFVVCFIFVFLLTSFIAKPIRVTGESMVPSLEDGEIGFTNVFKAKTQDVKRSDIVIVHAKNINELWVKRVVGLPGEVIEAKDDKVYINGKLLEEEYLDTEYANNFRKYENFTRDFPPVKLSEDEYFLMGDNRVVSYDSRVVGAFHKKDIVGKDAYILFPFDEIKIVD